MFKLTKNILIGGVLLASMAAGTGIAEAKPSAEKQQRKWEKQQAKLIRRQNRVNSTGTYYAPNTSTVYRTRRGNDVNSNGVPDVYERSARRTDRDFDGVPDYRDRYIGSSSSRVLRRSDRDRDGIPDHRDRYIGTSRTGVARRTDRDFDGIPDYRDRFIGTSRTGVRRSRVAGYRDIDRDGVRNNNDKDRDGDGVRNFRDRDKDGDGVPNNQDRYPIDPRRS